MSASIVLTLLGHQLFDWIVLNLTSKREKKSRNLIFIQDPDDWRLVQDGGEEGCALTSSCESSEITTIEQSLTGRCCNTHKKDTPRPKSKEKPQWDGRRGAVMIKSSPIPTGWATQRLMNTSVSEGLPLLWRFWAPFQAFQPGDLAKGLGIPRESLCKS